MSAKVVEADAGVHSLAMSVAVSFSFGFFCDIFSVGNPAYHLPVELATTHNRRPLYPRGGVLLYETHVAIFLLHCGVVLDSKSRPAVIHEPMSLVIDGRLVHGCAMGIS